MVRRAMVDSVVVSVVMAALLFRKKTDAHRTMTDRNTHRYPIPYT
jgi:hypothetical protein